MFSRNSQQDVDVRTFDIGQPDDIDFSTNSGQY